MSFRSLLSEIGIVSRRDTTPRNGIGELPETFSEVGRVRYGAQAAKASSRIQAGQLDRPALAAFFEIGADVQNEDLIVNQRTFRTYRIMSPQDAAGRGHHVEAILTEVVA